MLYPLELLRGFRILTLDGEIGTFRDCLFDPSWGVRYLVVETGGWFSGKTVVIPPSSFKHVSWSEHYIEVSLTRQAVERSPSIDERHLRQGEAPNRFEALRWPYYWTGSGVLGIAPEPAGLPRHALGPHAVADESTEMKALHSIEELSHCSVEALDGEFGRVSDAVLELDSARVTLRYLALEAHFGPADDVLKRAGILALDWVDTVDWSDAKVLANVSREQLRHLPPFDPKYGISAEYEAELREYYAERRKVAG